MSGDRTQGVRLSPFVFASLLAVTVSLGCYDPPALIADKPLTCAPSAAPDKDCPLAHSCMGGVCVKKTCAGPQDCPLAYVCGRTGCALPSADGGLRTSGPDAGGTD